MVKKSIKDQEKRLKDATPDKNRLHELEDVMKDAECEWGATKVTTVFNNILFIFVRRQLSPLRRKWKKLINKSLNVQSNYIKSNTH